MCMFNMLWYREIWDIAVIPDLYGVALRFTSRWVSKHCTRKKTGQVPFLTFSERTVLDMQFMFFVQVYTKNFSRKFVLWLPLNHLKFFISKLNRVVSAAHFYLKLINTFNAINICMYKNCVKIYRITSYEYLLLLLFIWIRNRTQRVLFLETNCM